MTEFNVGDLVIITSWSPSDLALWGDIFRKKNSVGQLVTITAIHPHQDHSIQVAIKCKTNNYSYVSFFKPEELQLAFFA